MAKKKGTRRQKRLERRAQREQHAQAIEREASSRTRVLLVIAALTIVGASALYLAELPKVWLGLLLFAGCGSWLAVALGGLGGRVKPRDRTKAGNIDYGNS